jgi:hypothetical protein
MECPIINDIKQKSVFPAYVAGMRKILGELAGWSAERVDTSIERSLWNRDFRAFFTQDTPASSASWSLIPDHLCRVLKVEDLAALHHRLCRAIEPEGSTDGLSPHENPRYDWESTHRMIADILREYDSGESAGLR